MKEKIKNFIKSITLKFYNFVKSKTILAAGVVKKSFNKCRNGEEDLKNILLYWSTIPCVVYFIMLKTVKCKFTLNMADLVMFVLIIFDLYFIAKTLKIHPEYNSDLMREVEKQKLYETLTDEQIKEEKAKESREGVKKIFYRFLTIRTGDKVDYYKIVRCILLLTFLIVFKRIFL
ncbi:MAG: hypothetical protein IJ853_02265 [Rickettsiales bacterium]|nr:hypothetical protein [Rickettsiales bacterium]